LENWRKFPQPVRARICQRLAQLNDAPGLSRNVREILAATQGEGAGQ
ncbi:MAG: aminopeptidase N C-terminal domain-containing protein, partial [Rhodocyclaceae bacterium]|nr:aminopeptidase N C-terminal domain-containing protein [Rhodocyclaceae bacterium]